ncbi:MAG: two-component sensor histidine kinase [Solirubrobacterales bacterium]|nr:two-component sensor histidine kinase [Solirubrobacterales bacterium]
MNARANMARAPSPLTTIFGWRGPEWLLDVVPVAFLLLEGAVAIVVLRHPERQIVPAVGLALTAVVLLWRRRAPLVALVTVLVFALLVNYGGVSMLPVLLAVFTVAEYRERRTVIAAAGFAMASVFVSPYLHGSSLSTIAQVVSRLVPIGMAVVVGLYLRTRADYVLGLQERAARLGRERELLARQAVADERLRIARELHDVVAHNVSLMVVQAQALAATGEQMPEQREALRRVADLGREAMAEMHRMLGVLRVQNGSAPELEPQPGVATLGELVRRTREADPGLEVELRTEGEPRTLPAGVDLSAYRIAQEALTNVVRHAAARHARVTLRYEPGALELSVADDGAGKGARPPAGRHGLVGMSERVTMMGGELHAGERRDGPGYEVHATLPFG